MKGPRGSEYRISLAALDEWMGRRDVLDSDTSNTGQTGTIDSQASLAHGASLASLADTTVQSAAVQVIVERLVAPLVDHLDCTQRELGSVREELGHERALREAAERDLAELRRSCRQMPWWLRLLVGNH